MSQSFDVVEEPSEPEDDYLEQSQALAAQYLAQHGVTLDMLHDMADDQAHAILKQALDFAAEQMTRMDAMVRLGQKDSDTKMNEQPQKRHTDRLARHVLKKARPK